MEFYDSTGAVVSVVADSASSDPVDNPSNSETIDKLFDQVVTGKNKWVDYTMGTCGRTITVTVDIPTSAVRYDFTTANDHAVRDPVEWQITWQGTTYPVVTWELGDPGRGTAYNGQNHFYITGHQTVSFTFFQLRDCDEAIAIHLSEIFFVASDAHYPDGPHVNALEYSSDPSNIETGEVLDNAFDLKRNNKWLDYTPGGCMNSITVTAVVPSHATSYWFVTANDAPNRDPTKWTLRVCNPSCLETEVLVPDPPINRRGDYPRQSLIITEDDDSSDTTTTASPNPSIYTVIFKFIETRNCETVQVSEIRFFDSGGGRIDVEDNSWSAQPDASPSGEGLESAFDDNVGTKWLSSAFRCDTPVEVTLKVSMNAVSYAFATADDKAERDPKYWQLTVCDISGVHCGETYDVAVEVEDIPSTRQQQYPLLALVNLSHTPTVSPSITPSVSTSTTTTTSATTADPNSQKLDFYFVEIQGCNTDDAAAQLSEIRFFDSSNNRVSVIANSWDSVSSSAIQNLFDENVDTQWIESAFACTTHVTVSVRVPNTATHYTFVTGTGSTNRDISVWGVGVYDGQSLVNKYYTAVPPSERQREYLLQYPIGVNEIRSPTSTPTTTFLPSKAPTTAKPTRMPLPADTCDKSSWSDVLQTCGGCKALVARMDSYYSTCNAYCIAHGRTCVAAYLENIDSCEEGLGYSCDNVITMNGATAKAAICECSINEIELNSPSLSPSTAPTSQPTTKPTFSPSLDPTTDSPSFIPSLSPSTFIPTTTLPSLLPSISPSRTPIKLKLVATTSGVTLDNQELVCDSLAAALSGIKSHCSLVGPSNSRRILQNSPLYVDVTIDYPASTAHSLIQSNDFISSLQNVPEEVEILGIMVITAGPSVAPSRLPSITPSGVPTTAVESQAVVQPAKDDPFYTDVMIIGPAGGGLVFLCIAVCVLYMYCGSGEKVKDSTKDKYPKRASEIQMIDNPSLGGGSKPKRTPSSQGLAKPSKRTRFDLSGNEKRQPDTSKPQSQKKRLSEVHLEPQQKTNSSSNMEAEFIRQLKSQATLDEFIFDEIVKQIEGETEIQESFDERILGEMERRHTITSKADHVSDLFHAFDMNKTGDLTLEEFRDGMKRFLEGPAKERLENSPVVLDAALCEEVFQFIDTDDAGLIGLRQWLDFCNRSPSNPNVQFVQEVILVHAGIDPTTIQSKPLTPAQKKKKGRHKHTSSHFDGMNLEDLEDLRLYVQESFKVGDDDQEEDSSFSSDHARGDTIMEISDDSSDELMQDTLIKNRQIFMGGT